MTVRNGRFCFSISMWVSHSQTSLTVALTWSPEILESFQVVPKAA